MVKRYELSERQWQRIAQLLPGKIGDPGRTGADNRRFVNGVLWVLRSGARWHDLPERYGKWKTAHSASPVSGARHTTILNTGSRHGTSQSSAPS